MKRRMKIIRVYYFQLWHTLGLYNLIYRLAKSSSPLKNENITYNTELWDSDYYMLLLSGYSRYLETDAKMLFLSLEYLTYFIKKVLSLRKICSLILYYLGSWILCLESSSGNFWGYVVRKVAIVEDRLV